MPFALGAKSPQAESPAVAPAAVTWSAGASQEQAGTPSLVLFDRDGTLVHDVPYNGDPSKVVPVPGARGVLDRLRSHGVRVGIVTNQSGVARGLISAEQVSAVNARVEELLGPFDVSEVCLHGESDGCPCRKPQPGMVLAAASQLGLAPSRCAVVGDTGADVDAARAAGARGVLVPNEVTRTAEVLSATHIATNLTAAVEGLLVDHPKERT